MSLIGRMLRNRRGSGSAKPESTSGADAGIGLAAESVTLSMASEQLQRALLMDGDSAQAAAVLRTPALNPDSADQAVKIVREVVLPIVEECLRRGDAATACWLESAIYGKLIRRFEYPAHYEACFDVLDEAMHTLGMRLRAERQPAAGRRNGLLFYLHNASSTAAHIPLFCDILGAYLAANPEVRGSDFGVCGFAEKDGHAPRLQELAAKHGVRLLAARASQFKCLMGAAERVYRGEFERLVVVAVPLGLSFLSGLLPSSRLGWLTMKFELDCFANLEHRASIISSLTKDASRPRKRWLQAPPFIDSRTPLRSSGLPNPVLSRARRHPVLFYTINRAEKIRHPDYLACVAEVLERMPDAGFAWTGREPLGEIVEFFRDRGLAERTHFVGWVPPDDLIVQGDVFLDTPTLSGTVAARAIASGKAVVTLVRSQSWVNVYLDIQRADREAGRVSSVIEGVIVDDRVLPFECADLKAYVELACVLGECTDARTAFGQALASFADRYFYDSPRWANLHMANWRAGLSVAANP